MVFGPRKALETAFAPVEPAGRGEAARLRPVPPHHARGSVPRRFGARGPRRVCPPARDRPM